MEHAHHLIWLEQHNALHKTLKGVPSMFQAFYDMPEIVAMDKALPGVSWETILQLTHTPRRSVVNGRHVVTLLVNDGEAWNVIAWEPTEPAVLYASYDLDNWVLGRDNLCPMGCVQHNTVLEWLQSGMKGCVYLG